MLKKFFGKKDREEKAFGPFGYPIAGLFGGVFAFANSSVQWMQYYSTVAPVGDGIDKIAEKGSKIPLLLFASDKSEAEIPVNNHPFLKLLKSPNPYQTQEDLVKEALVHERATGNNYVYLTGGISADKKRIISNPIEMYNLRPDYMVIGPDPTDGRALYYQYTMLNGTILIFDRTEIIDVRGKLVEAYIERNGFGQLFHFRNLSSRRVGGYFQLLGDAPLQSAEIQIGQFFEAAVYNYFLIKNGLSAKNIISPSVKEPLSVDQLNKLRSFIMQEYSGSVNSGKTIVSTLPITATSISINPKDMDFKALNADTTNAVYRKLNIPLPLVDGDNTSMANMEISNLMLYDEAVIPALELFCARMFTFPIAQRYKDAKELSRFGFNLSSIPALQPRIAYTLKLYKESGDTTVNERREVLGLSRVDSDGCDDIYINKNMVVIGTDTNLEDTIGVDKRADKKARLKNLMQKHKKPDGTPFYTEQEIEDAILH